MNVTKGIVRYSRESKSYATQPFTILCVLSPSVLSKRRVLMCLGKDCGLQEVKAWKDKQGQQRICWCECDKGMLVIHWSAKRFDSTISCVLFPLFCVQDFKVYRQEEK